LRDLGSQGVTNGSFKHDFIMRTMPSFAMQMAINKIAPKVYERYKAKLEKEKKE
jgi:hypothetical protein